MNSHFLKYGPLLIAIILLSACRSKKEIASSEPLKNRSALYLTNQLEKKSFEFDWLGAKLSSEVEMEGQKESFKANVRMRKDSIVWISISPALGVEMIRMLISGDSVKYISKIPQNKHYYIGDFTSIEDFLGVDVDLHMLQNLIVGNPIAFEPKEDKFKSQVDANQYVLTSKYKRKVEKLVGADDKDLDPDLDSLRINPNDKTYQKLIEKRDEDELIIKRYYLNRSFQLVKTVFLDLYNNRSLIIEHRDHRNLGSSIYPGITRLEVQQPGQDQILEFELMRLKKDKPYEFPFEIPEAYERKYY